MGKMGELKHMFKDCLQPAIGMFIFLTAKTDKNSSAAKPLSFQFFKDKEMYAEGPIFSKD